MKHRYKVSAVLALVLGWPVLSWGDTPAVQSTAATTHRGSISQDDVRLRESANLDQLMILRQAADEAAMDGAAKLRLLAAIEMSRQRTLAKIAETASRPYDERSAAIESLRSQVGPEMRRAIGDDPAQVKPFGESRNRITAELNLLRGDQAVVSDLLAKLKLDPKQEAAAKAVLDAMGKKLQEANPGASSERERRTEVLLAARADLRRIIQPLQWDDLDAQIALRRREEQQRIDRPHAQPQFERPR